MAGGKLVLSFILNNNDGTSIKIVSWGPIAANLGLQIEVNMVIFYVLLE